MEFIAQGALPANAPTWSRVFLQSLAPGALTPFSQSTLTEIVGRAWYLYYSRLEFAPTPRARVVRSYQGRPYVNLTLSAQLEVQHAGIEPPVYVINGQMRPVCTWEKPGLLAGMKLGRGARKVADTAVALEAELDDLAARAQSWLQRVSGLRWSQAELLQIMEEIENAGAPSLSAFFAARQRLESAASQFFSQARSAQHPQPAALLAQVLAAQQDRVEGAIVRQIVALAAAAQREPVALDYLATGDCANWTVTLPAGAFAEQLRVFLAAYGHRCAGEGELQNPRWSEDPAPVFHAILVATRGDAPQPRAVDLNALFASFDGRQRKALLAQVATMQQAQRLQSKALHAYAYILAGARQWALAAGKEAASDGRLGDFADVFFYELEEVKQMMTGEWNISDQSGIRATAEERKAQAAAWCASNPSELLIGDVEVRLAGASGQMGVGLDLALLLS
jgi:pyruvate,water dikinase